MKIKPPKNPVCERCEFFSTLDDNQIRYEWMCGKCFTIYRAKLFRKNEKQWFEFKPFGKAEVPMGLSKWKQHGEKYGYWKFFEEEVNSFHEK